MGGKRPVSGLIRLLGKLSPDQHLRGRQFERLCLWFFSNDPIYSAELKRVWLWRDWRPANGSRGIRALGSSSLSMRSTGTLEMSGMRDRLP